MKKLLLTSIIAILLSSFSYAQPHPGQNSNGTTPTGGPLSGDESPGGGAPIGSGLTLMLIMGAAYGLKKWRNQVNLEE